MCRGQLGELQENYDDIIAAGGSLIAISADDTSGAKNAADAIDNTFTVLSDSSKTAISAYNVVNKNNAGYAQPSVFIIKTDGTIGYKSIDGDYSRSDSSSIISALDDLD